MSGSRVGHKNLVATARLKRIPLKDLDGRVIRDAEGNTTYGSWIETVRTGTCPDHDKRTVSFVGTNEHGWIFRCPGLTDRDVEGTSKPTAEPHYFVNDPAPEVRPLAEP